MVDDIASQVVNINYQFNSVKKNRENPQLNPPPQKKRGGRVCLAILFFWSYKVVRELKNVKKIFFLFKWDQMKELVLGEYCFLWLLPCQYMFPLTVAWSSDINSWFDFPRCFRSASNAVEIYLKSGFNQVSRYQLVLHWSFYWVSNHTLFDAHFFFFVKKDIFDTFIDRLLGTPIHSKKSSCSQRLLETPIHII